MADISVPFFRPSISSEEIRSVSEVLLSGYLTTGAVCEKFESRFAKFVGIKNAISLNSGTAALHLALVASGIGAGDAVFIPALSFAALYQVVEWVGAIPVMVDSEPETLCLCPESLRLAVEQVGRLVQKGCIPVVSPKAVIVINYAGHLADYSMIRKVCNEYGMLLIEDASHSLGGAWRACPEDPWQFSGQLGDYGCFSFYANKPICTGEGGMLVTDDDDMANVLYSMRLHGFEGCGGDTRWATWHRQVVRPGYKYNMPDTAAALGLCQLDKAYNFLACRSAIARQYSDHLGKCQLLKLPHELPNRRHAWHIYSVRLLGNTDAELRNEVIRELGNRNIGTSVHWYPLHKHQYFQNGLTAADLSVTEKAYSSMISLPIFPSMTSEQVEYVSKSLIYVLEKYVGMYHSEKLL